MAKKSLIDRACTINTSPTTTARLLNQVSPLTLTATDRAYLQRTLNVSAHFAQAFIQQKPEDFMLWAEAWGKCMQFLEMRFGITEPNYQA